MTKEWIIRPRERIDWTPDYERDLHDPFLLRDMAPAVERIWRAIRDEEKILIFADYDADGVPGAAALSLFFQKVGFTNFTVYIPDRHLEDYGLSRKVVEEAAAAGVRLLITIDCGIANVAEVTLARDLGLEVIITDHHLPPAVLPPANLIINPKRADCTYPNQGLCGAGVVFKLVQALASENFFQVLGNNPQTMKKVSAGSAPAASLSQWTKWLLDLIAIATVGDMVPLTGENRALVHFGLRVLRRSPRPGLQQLFRELRLEQAYLTEDDIGFSIAPRINTASRMAHAREAFELLTTADVAVAGALAKRLEKLNKERKSTVEKILADIDGRLVDAVPPIIVVGDESWSLGVLGLAASRVVERYRRPVFLWGRNGNGIVKGSCRSDGSVNVVELMRLADPSGDFFLNIGGHERAGGFSLAGERVTALPERLAAAFATVGKTEINDTLWLEGELELEGVTAAIYNQLEQWGPFGLENPKPIFLFRGVEVGEVKAFGGARNHLELLLRRPGSSRSTGRPLKAISFFNLFPALELAPGQALDVAATLEKSYFRGPPTLRLRIVDLRKAAN